MNGNARQVANAKYRRGTVLGLTVAEIFILLLFLLMLVFLVLWQDWQSDSEEQREEIGQLQQQLQLLQEAGIETPDEIRTLVALNDYVEQMQQRTEQSESSDEPNLLAVFDEAERARREAVEETERLNEALEQERQARQEAEEKGSESERGLREAEERVFELEHILTKGVNPPCWYEVVEDENAVGGRRERGLYAFDIGVFDDYMVIRRRAPPEGGAVGDGDSTYQEEWTALRMADIRYDVPLSNAELVAELQRIHDAGKEGDVRSYSCVFYVRVWDETSSGAKMRWQEAHDRTLEWLFGTSTVRDEPWRGSD